MRGKKITSVLIAAAGTLLMAVGTNMIYEPLSMVTGGFSGIAIIIKKLTGTVSEEGIPLWVTILALNIPLFIFAGKQRGIGYVKKTVIAVAMYSFFLYLVPGISIGGRDYLTAALIGGAVNGAGLALVFSQGMTTGGTDLLSSLIQWYLPHISVARLLLIIDGVIVTFGMGCFGVRIGVYAVIAVFVTTKIMDNILEGFKFAKMAYVISAKGNDIGKDIMDSLERGVSSLNVKGLYSGKDKQMLLCVVSNKEIVRLKDIVARCDQDAFVIISDVREVTGEGFMKNNK